MTHRINSLEFHRRSLVLAGILSGAAGLGGAPAQATESLGIIGAVAPEPRADFWIDAQGRPTVFALSAHRGKWVHMKFWQSWCPGCHAHGFPALARLVEAFQGDPRVVNVALQTVFEGAAFNRPEQVRKTQLRYRLPIVFGHDSANATRGPSSGTMRAFRSGGTPWHVLVNPAGRVVYNDFSIDPDRAAEHIRRSLASYPAKKGTP